MIGIIVTSTTLNYYKWDVHSGTLLQTMSFFDFLVVHKYLYACGFPPARKKNYLRMLPNKSRLQVARDLCIVIRRVLRLYYFVIEFRRTAIIHHRYFCADLLPT